MASVDRRGAYFHIKMKVFHHRFFRFHWLSKWYQVWILLFGLFPAPCIFRKTLVPS